MSSMPTPVDTARRVSSAQPDTAWQSIIATQCSGRFAACQPPRGDAAPKGDAWATRATCDAQPARQNATRATHAVASGTKTAHTCHEILDSVSSGHLGCPWGQLQRRRERGPRHRSGVPACGHDRGRLRSILDDRRRERKKLLPGTHCRVRDHRAVRALAGDSPASAGLAKRYRREARPSHSLLRPRKAGSL